MIEGFEKYTCPLNDYERETLLPLIVAGLETKIGKSRCISGSQIVSAMKGAGYKLDAPRLRKIVNYIRIHDMVPWLVSSSKGYYVATEEADVDECITSLRGRVEATQAVIDALTRQKNNRYRR